MSKKEYTSREEYIFGFRRDESDAKHAHEGAQHTLTDKREIVFVFTDEQIEKTRREMEEALKGSYRKRADANIGVEPEKPATMFCEIRGRKIEIANKALCSFEDLLRAKHIIEAQYPDLIRDLPIDHPWRQVKITHELIASAGLQSVLADFRSTMKEENYYLLLLIAGIHDLGRPVMAKKQLGLLPPETDATRHDGHYTAELLQQWGALDAFPKKTQELILYVIIHHADKQTPSLSEIPTEFDTLKYAFTCAVRDLDKLSTFNFKTDLYLFDAEEKRKQTVVNNLTGEERRIDPPSMLDTFAQRLPLDRRMCRSYEAFMLQYLAWIFDLNLPESVKAAVASGVVKKLLGYFKGQLSQAEFSVIDQSTQEYLKRFET